MPSRLWSPAELGPPLRDRVRAGWLLHRLRRARGGLLSTAAPASPQCRTSGARSARCLPARELPLQRRGRARPDLALSRREGTFSHQTALALHQLSDALPSKLHLTVPTAWKKRRIKVPRDVVLYFADLQDDDRTWQGPVQVTTPLRTVVDCSADARSPDLVEQAKRQGLRRRLFTRADLKRSAAERAGSSRGAA